MPSAVRQPTFSSPVKLESIASRLRRHEPVRILAIRVVLDRGDRGRIRRLSPTPPSSRLTSFRRWKEAPSPSTMRARAVRRSRRPSSVSKLALKVSNGRTSIIWQVGTNDGVKDGDPEAEVLGAPATTESNSAQALKHVEVVLVDQQYYPAIKDLGAALRAVREPRRCDGCCRAGTILFALQADEGLERAFVGYPRHHAVERRVPHGRSAATIVWRSSLLMASIIRWPCPRSRPAWPAPSPRGPRDRAIPRKARPPLRCATDLDKGVPPTMFRLGPVRSGRFFEAGPRPAIRSPPMRPLLGFHRHPDHRGGFQPLVGYASSASATLGGAVRRLPQG